MAAEPAALAPAAPAEAPATVKNEVITPVSVAVVPVTPELGAVPTSPKSAVEPSPSDLDRRVPVTPKVDQDPEFEVDYDADPIFSVHEPAKINEVGASRIPPPPPPPPGSRRHEVVATN